MPRSKGTKAGAMAVGTESGSASRRATVLVGETCSEEGERGVEIEEEDDEDDDDEKGRFSWLPPTAVGGLLPGLPWALHKPRPIAPKIQRRMSRPIIHTTAEKPRLPFRVFLSHELSFWRVSSPATILNLRQKSSPFCPRLGNSVSSVFPRMIFCVSANFTSRERVGDGGRAKAGDMGVEGG